MSDYMTEDHHVKKKKKKTADISFSENISYSEHSELEGSGKKKKKKKKNKHRSTDDETITEVSYLENLSPSYSHSSFVKYEEHTSEQESSTQDCNSNTWKSSKKSKKKKRMERSVEETLVETDHAAQPRLYDDHNHSDEALLSESVSKKKKRRRLPESRSLEEDDLEDIQQTSPLITLNENTNVERSSKKKTVSAQKTSREVATGANRTVKAGTEPKTVGCLSPKVRRSQKVTLAESTSFNEDLDASEHVPEPASCETDDNVRMPAKTKKSAKYKKSKGNQDQDVTAELENSGEDQMETTQDEETGDPKKENNDGPEGSRPSVSAKKALSLLRPKDLALLEEYFPRLRYYTSMTISYIANYELCRLKEAKEKGLLFETGRFDSTEDEIIKKNVEDFRQLVGLESAEMLFYSYRFPDQKKTIEMLKRKYYFVQRIAKGLARPVSEVYNRGIKIYDLSGKKGRYTEEEVEKLKKGCSIHGKNWIAVAKLVGRSQTNVQLKASQLRREFTGGRWSAEEENRLIKAVKEFVLNSLKNQNVSKKEPRTVPKEMLYSGISWAKIEEKVDTRNWTHCKSKWHEILLVRMNGGRSPCTGALGIQTHIDIIKWLHEDELRRGRVNWLKMAKDIGNIPPAILQLRVYTMKCRYVPDWQSRRFQEIVDYLVANTLPVLEAKLDGAIASRGAMAKPEKKDEFLISEIFRECVGDDKLSKSVSSDDSDDSS